MPASSRRRKSNARQIAATRPARRFHIPRHWLVRIALFVAITALYQYGVRRTVGITGDEPHYLMTVASLIADGDFDESNNYANHGASVVGYPLLVPQARQPDGRVLPEHGLGFPLLLLLPARVLGLLGLKYVLMAVMVAAALLLCACADRIFGAPLASTLAGLALMLLPVWQVFGPRVYPEVTAGWLALAVFAMVTSPVPGTWAAFSAGLLIGYLPLLYLRFSPLALFLFAIALLNPAIRRLPAFWYGLVLSALFAVVLTASVFGSRWYTSTPSSTGLRFDGSIERFWRLWFDRGHGIAPANPLLLLLFWAAPLICFRALRDPRLRPAALLSLMIFAYSCEFALAPTASGESPPGRFLCAASAPALLVLCYWIAPGGRVLWIRASAALALAAVGAGIVGAGIISNTPAWLAFPRYQDLFPTGWPLPSFTAGVQSKAGDSSPLGWTLLCAWASTSALGAVFRFFRSRTATAPESTTD